MRTFLNSPKTPVLSLPVQPPEACAVPCGECPLDACRAGERTVVVALCCEATEAVRLRSLGLIEGAPVTVVDRRHGLLLEVRGARVAISASIAALVNVRPLAA